MKKISFCLILFIFCSFRADNDLITKIATALVKYAEEYPQEKIYLHLDKPYYATKDTIWFKAYITDAHSLLPTAISKVLYVEMINPDKQVVSRRMLKIKEGIAYADFPVGDSLKAGAYQVRAYTQWMQNFDNALFFTKDISVFDLKKDSLNTQYAKKISLKFFPEGGELINGLRCRVAFKASNQNGEGENIKGYIADNEGKKIVSLKTEHLGMGSFRFIPEKGKSYEAHIFDGDSTETVEKLPISKEEGFALVVLSSEEDSIFKVNIYASEGIVKQQADIVLVSQAKNQIFHAFQGKIDRQIVTANIPKSKLPEGITQLTLFDSKGEPQCERLVFTRKATQHKASITTDKSGYKAREKVKLSIEIKDGNGKLTEGNFSMSVTDIAKVSENEIDTENITNYMLLRGDIGGQIEKPNYYFQKGKYDALDLLLMTQGWRRFTWKKLLSADSTALAYTPEMLGFSVRGEVFDEKTNKVISDASLVIRKINAFATSDKNGAFAIDNLDFEDEAEIIAQAAQFKDKKLNIFFEEKLSPEVKNIQKRVLFDEMYVKNRKKQFEADMAFDSKVRVLDAVEVKSGTGKPTEEAQELKQRASMGLSYGKPDYVVKASDKQDVFAQNNSNVLGVLMTNPIPGVRVIPDPNNAARYLVTMQRAQGNSINFAPPIVYLVDGVRVEAEIAQNINATSVKSIEVVKRAIPSMNIQGGVISIITKNVDDLFSNVPKVDKYQINGYYKAREFYAPDYEKTNINSPKPDLRSTIYWNPNITTEAGKANVSFFAADNPKQYKVVIEGISKDGRTLSEVKIVAF